MDCVVCIYLNNYDFIIMECLIKIDNGDERPTHPKHRDQLIRSTVLRHVIYKIYEDLKCLI